MSDLNFTPVLSEILSVISGMQHSLMYFGNHCGKNLLILKHQTKTVMVVLNNQNNWIIEFHTTVSSRDQSIKTGYKIVGNQNSVLLLDGTGKLWRLINAFEFSNEKDECLYLLDEKCFYEWVPVKKFEYFSVFEITAVQHGFACLLENRRLEKKLQIFAVENWNLLEDYTFEDINIMISNNSYLSATESVLKRENGEFRQGLIFSDRLSGRTYLSMGSDKHFIMNISNIPLISVLNFPEKKCLMLCYQNGKFVFFMYNGPFDLISQCTLYAYKTVVSIQKCVCSESCILWSDGINLNHTNIQFNFKNTCFANLIHLKVGRNVRGIRSFIRVHNGVLAVTKNNFYYNITINESIKAEEIVMSTDEILSKIYEGGLKIDSISKEIKFAEDYLEFKEIMQNNYLKDHIEIKRNQKNLILKINLKKTFKKNIWRLKQTSSVNNKHYVEIIDLPNDLNEEEFVEIESNLMTKGSIDLSLIGDFGVGFDVLVIYLGKVTGDKNYEEDELEKNLIEIAKMNNPYFK